MCDRRGEVLTFECAGSLCFFFSVFYFRKSRVTTLDTEQRDKSANIIAATGIVAVSTDTVNV